MAHVVGVPKRDPCQKCKLPVFLAERLTIGKKVYHRTCLKCARCNYQLTPGSFYETEVDGEYCCETCPDEEKSLNNAGPSTTTSTSTSTANDENSMSTAMGRGSIADRLAFFENDGKKLLQKSMSDEEKTQSLKKITETQKNVYKHNSALSQFMNSHLSDAADSPSSGQEHSITSSRRNSNTTDDDDDDDDVTASDIDDLSSDHQVPELPKTLPPTLPVDISDIREEEDDDAIKTSRESSLSLEQQNVNNSKSPTTSDNHNMQVAASDNIEQIETASTPISTLQTDKTINDLNVRMNVTKDSSDTDDKTRENLTATTADKFDDISTENRSSMVRARLHQFETISNNSSASSISISNLSPSSKEIRRNSVSITVDTEQNESMETEVPKIVVIEDNIEKNHSSLKSKLNAEDYTNDASNPIDDTKVVKPKTEEYPEDLNPFKSDDEDEVPNDSIVKSEKRKSLNPFGSSDEDEEDVKNEPTKKIKPPRPPPPKRVSTNPFGSESEDEGHDTSAGSSGIAKKTPIPTPRSHLSTSQHTTPEPTPRLTRQSYGTPLKNSAEYYGSDASLTTPGSLNTSIEHFRRDSDVRGSANSTTSSGGKGRKIRKPPAPKPPQSTAKELFPSSIVDSKKSSPTSSLATTPTPRKKRPAPAPPSALVESNTEDSEKISKSIQENPNTEVNLKTQEDLRNEVNVDQNEPIISDRPSPTDEELLKTDIKPEDSEVIKPRQCDEDKLREASLVQDTSIDSSISSENRSTRKLITLDASLLEDSNSSFESRPKEEESVVYRRTIAPLIVDNILDDNETESHDRQLEKLKDNKEAQNRNRQSQISLSPNDENDPLFNKSVHGKWKRRKGPAPGLPVPPKKVLQMLPLQEIRHELEIIEVQQQGLEKQGVMLEKMIRERCEGQEPEESKEENTTHQPTNSKEVEDLIMQLFELVNEKNELFRRQAELMYLRRQHRLEQEQADLEYEIRVLMAQPERNKTDSDKAREETLIARLVEVVQLRNEVVDCLEMDRLREAEEDLSIKQRLELHTAQRDEELCKQTPTKLSKKEKKRQKESKKIGKSKKLDADKDADESELSADKQKLKKKKKNILSSVIAFK